MAAKFWVKTGRKITSRQLGAAASSLAAGGRPRPAVERLGRLRSISRAPALDLDKVKPGEQQADSARRR